MKRFGLIGFPLAHSFSQKYFTEKFHTEKIEDCVYESFPIPTIDAFPELLVKYPDLVGLNVTIPYKEKIVAYLNQKSKIVIETGACNCIHIQKGKLTGYNTDVAGFQQSLQNSFSRLPSQALILGTGGASKAVAYVLNQLKITYLFVSRKPSSTSLSYEQLTPEIIKKSKLIINTTPLGMFPKVIEAPPIPYEAIGTSHCLFDLIYNPERTLFLQKGTEYGAAVQNGLEMLKIQAEEGWKIWNAE